MVCVCVCVLVTPRYDTVGSRFQLVHNFTYYYDGLKPEPRFASTGLRLLPGEPALHDGCQLSSFYYREIRRDRRRLPREGSKSGAKPAMRRSHSTPADDARRQCAPQHSKCAAAEQARNKKEEVEGGRRLGRAALISVRARARLNSHRHRCCCRLRRRRCNSTRSRSATPSRATCPRRGPRLPRWSRSSRSLATFISGLEVEAQRAPVETREEYRS